MHTAIAIAHARLADLLDAFFKTGLTGPTGFVMIGRRVKTKYATSTADRYAPIDQYPVDKLALAARP